MKTPQHLKRFKLICSYALLSLSLSLYSQNKEESVTFFGLSQTLDSSDIHLPGANYIEEALKGKIAGLELLEVNGKLSFTPGLDPLIVIDGIPQVYNLYPYSHYSIFDMIPVALNDVESIQFIDCFPAIMNYGEKGKNGAILIQTKKDIPGKFHFTYRGQGSYQFEPVYPEMLSGNEYIMYQIEAWHNTNGIIEIPDEISYNPDFEDFHNYSDSTDWIGAVTQPGFFHDHFLSMSGGTKKTRLYGSLSYQKEKGTLINTGLRNYRARLSVTHVFSSKVKLSGDFQYQNKHSDNPAEFNGTDMLDMAFKKAPNMSIREYSSDGTLTGVFFTPIENYQGSGYDYYNPIALSKLGLNKLYQEFLQGRVNLDVKLLDWLTFNESLYMALSEKTLFALTPKSSIVTSAVAPMSNEIYLGRQRGTDLANESSININVPISGSDHQFKGKLSLLSRYRTYTRTDFGNDTLIQASNYLNDLDRYSDTEHSGNIAIQYAYKNKYYVSGFFRPEYFSIPFYNTYPSKTHSTGVSGSWRFSEEELLNQVSWFNEGAISLEYISVGAHKFDLPYYMRSALSTKLNLLLFENRIHIWESFITKTIDVTIAAETGSLTESAWNTNLEIILARKSDFNWDIFFNTTHKKRNLENYPSNGAVLHYPRAFLPYPSGNISGLNYLGVYSTSTELIAKNEDGSDMTDGSGNPVYMSYSEIYSFMAGDAKYEDTNFDGIIDFRDTRSLGNIFPKLSGGFGSSLRYRNLHVNVRFHYRLGHQLIKQYAFETQSLTGYDNQSKAVLNRWRVQGQDDPGLLPRATLDSPANSLASSRFVESGSYVRMDYLNIAYHFNEQLCRKIHLSNIAINLTGQRLYTFTGYTGLDPEVSVYDDIRLLAPMSITLGVEIGL